MASPKTKDRTSSPQLSLLKGVGCVSVSTEDSVQPIDEDLRKSSKMSSPETTERAMSGDDRKDEGDDETDDSDEGEDGKGEADVTIVVRVDDENAVPPVSNPADVVVDVPRVLPTGESSREPNQSSQRRHPYLTVAKEEFSRLPPSPPVDELLQLAALPDDEGGEVAGKERIEEEEEEEAVGSTAHSTLPFVWADGREFESLDYDRNFNTPYQKVVDHAQTHATRDEVIRWFVTFVIGVATGLVALFIDLVVKRLNQLKFSTVSASVVRCSEDGCLAMSLILLVAFNVAFVFVASLCVYVEPCAAGSGIPEIKCYLNGVKVPRVVRLKTLVAKAVGVLFSVAGGLFCGKEGPMIHSGAVIGCGIPQFQSVTFKMINFNFPFFRTDRDKRDFVSGGAAAGVAAAFGAPVGGVLFSLEEGSSFWNQALTWRTFFCAMSATFTLNFFLSGINGGDWGAFNQPGLLSFGEFVCGADQPDCRLWDLYDIVLFIILGIGGGLLGAVFNTLNGDLTRWRMKSVHRRPKYARILEAVLVALVTTVVTFTAAMGLGECKELPKHEGNGTEVAVSVQTFFCGEGSYNDMATLFFNPQEVAIRQLFHQQGIFSIPTLGTFFILFFLLACWTYGASVPSGLFVPALLCGAAYGRLFGNLLSLVGYRRVYHGTFALMGSAAFLGGVARMTISLTIILIESTNNIVYGLPIMITLMVAKWTGDMFNEGIYDKHITIKGVPFLEWEAPTFSQKLQAKDVMDVNLIYVYPHSKVRSLVNILKTCTHNAFPVVTSVPPQSTATAAPTATPTATPTTTPWKSKSEPTFGKEDENSDFLFSNNLRYRAVSVITRAKEVKTRQNVYRQMSTSPPKTIGIPSATTVEKSPVAGLKGSKGGAGGGGRGGEGGGAKLEKAPTTEEILKRLRACSAASVSAALETNGVVSPGASSASDATASGAAHTTGVSWALASNASESAPAHAPAPASAPAASDPPALTFHGLILRSELVTLLERQVWYFPEETPASQWTVDYAEMTSGYPRYPSIHDIKVAESAKENIVDLTPYINPSPYTVPANMPVSQVFHLFRSMGLRHLIVINAFGDAVGIITRHNLTHEHLHNQWEIVKMAKQLDGRVDGQEK